MNNKIILWSIAVGLGGFLFGMDVAVISGAEKAIQELWHLSDWTHGTAIAMALYGTAFGAAFGNITANRLGRKKSLIWIGLIFLVSAVGAALAQDVNTFMVMRFLSGLSIGASSVVAPVYFSEIFPNAVRASGTSFGSLTHWFWASIIAQVFPFFAENIGGSFIFGFFALMMLLQLLFVWRMMPETKGIKLVDMDKTTLVLH